LHLRAAESGTQEMPFAPGIGAIADINQGLGQTTFVPLCDPQRKVYRRSGAPENGPITQTSSVLTPSHGEPAV